MLKITEERVTVLEVKVEHLEKLAEDNKVVYRKIEQELSEIKYLLANSNGEFKEQLAVLSTKKEINTKIRDRILSWLIPISAALVGASAREIITVVSNHVTLH